ncbi:MAG: 4,5-DOPA dioxygenase extradiol [Ilumatobacteraceae bacterium]
MSRMPAVFIGHGSPMNTLESNGHTAAWAEFGASVPVPRAILAVSAHWWIGSSLVTAMEKPRTIHDFYGFPDELFAFDYPVVGSPELAAKVTEMLAPVWVGADRDGWGIDHGTWSVLAHMFPAADVPVVQLSLDATKAFADHVALGRALAPLRDEGVLVLCSGNVVHNLGRLDWSAGSSGEPWAVEFDAHVAGTLKSDPSSLAGAPSHPAWALSAPTPDHFVPVLYFAGLASAGGAVRTLTDGCAMGSLSMSSWVLD